MFNIGWPISERSPEQGGGRSRCPKIAKLWEQQVLRPCSELGSRMVRLSIRDPDGTCTK